MTTPSNWHPRPHLDGVGGLYAVRGHWSGDFQGRMTYRGDELCLFRDTDGREREICYLQNVVFMKLADA